MQDIHSMGSGGGGGSFFGGGGDRRLRPHQHHAAAAATATALKCPRCDSLNTKFCYYNNYNLSQPRHFCKSCRRYWTKGGVLRNVPVGGGCRKTKRSSKPKTTPSSDSVAANKSNTNSCSESSNVVATNASTEPLHVIITPSMKPNSNPNSNSNPSPSAGSGFELMDQDSTGCGLFGEIGSFTSLMGSGDDGIGFGFGPGPRGDEKIMIDQTVGVDLGGGYGSSDWQNGGGDQGLFDLTDTVDHAYWSQTGDHQWSDQVHVHVQDQHHHHSNDLYNFP